MFRVQTLSRVSPIGLELFSHQDFEVASEIPSPDAILVRSTDMHSMEFPASLKCIARAGIGINNIPVERCTAKGIVVFNTPGANANGVKELVLTALFLSSRKIVEGIRWLEELRDRGEEIPRLVEAEKSRFSGPEIRGRRLGVIGLGSVGVRVANDAVALGMKVTGFDPFISVESAWGLSREVSRARVLESLIAEADYITLHVPLMEKTRGMINRERFSLMKKGTRLLNFARGGLVNNVDLRAALEDGTVACYVTDFPDSELLGMSGVISIPHLGASTAESEDNCAIMASKQTIEYLQSGNIKNSVNFPECDMGQLSTACRLLIANRNIPNMVGQVTAVLAGEHINIADMLNRHRDDLAYNIIDLDRLPAERSLATLGGIDGIVMVRTITNHR